MAFEDIKGNLTWTQIVLIAGLAMYFIALNTMTAPVPNLQNVTDENNETGAKILFTAEDNVYPEYVSGGKVIFGIMLTAALAGSFIMGQRAPTKRMTEREVKEFVITEFMKKKEIKLPNGQFEADNYEFDEILSVITRYHTVKDVSKPFKVILNIVMRNKRSGLPQYFKVHVHPFQRTIDDIIPTDYSMKESDKCPRCGKEYDEKYIDTDDIRKSKEIWSGFGRRTS